MTYCLDICSWKPTLIIVGIATTIIILVLWLISKYEIDLNQTSKRGVKKDVKP